MSESSAAIDQERLRWIETWARGWREYLNTRSPVPYDLLALDVATAMIEELVTSLRDPNYALDLIADVLHESGQEISEIIEKRRWDKSANAAEVRA